MQWNEIDLQSVFDNLYDGIYCVDGKRRITYWNKGAERLTGFSSEEVKGSRCMDNLLVHVDTQGRPLCAVGCPLQKTLRDGETRQADLYLHHKEGYRVPVRVRIVPLLNSDGSIRGAVEVFSDNGDRRAMLERISSLERLAMLDQLTELPNRRYLEMSLSLRVNELERYGWPFGVLLIDIDHFKAINDTYGHEMGDRVLRMIARTLDNSSRAFDVVGRWGGEEFLAVVSHLDDTQLRQVAERLHALIASSGLGGADEDIRVTASVGAAMATGEDTAESIVRRVDERLYEAKRRGRDQVVVNGADEPARAGAADAL